MGKTYQIIEMVWLHSLWHQKVVPPVKFKGKITGVILVFDIIDIMFGVNIWN